MSILVYRIEILINRLPALPLDTRPAFGMRLEFVEMGRRRRWSDAEKLRLVEASMAGRRMVSATARQHGISRSLLTT